LATLHDHEAEEGAGWGGGVRPIDLHQEPILRERERDLVAQAQERFGVDHWLPLLLAQRIVGATELPHKHSRTSIPCSTHGCAAYLQQHTPDLIYESLVLASRAATCLLRLRLRLGGLGWFLGHGRDRV
jgi:hypothetical protein